MRALPSLLIVIGTIAASSAIPGFTSISSAAPPPERLALNWHMITDAHGHALSVGYFTEGQLHDAAWEFRRLQGPLRARCAGTAAITHRDVQWFAAGPGSTAMCARVTYTVHCVADTDHSSPAPPDSLLATRAAVMARLPTEIIGADCGEKDVEVRQRNGTDPVRKPLPPGNQLRDTVSTPPPPAPPVPVRPRQ